MINRISTISEYHRSREIDKPLHPMISLIDYRSIEHTPEINTTSWMLDFYMIALKRNIAGKIKYGQQDYDFDEGTMFFIAPGQVFKIEINQESPERSGWMLLIHPDFFWRTTLAKSIKKYEYFNYTTHEALFLSGQEEKILFEVIQNIKREYENNIDKFSQPVMLAQIDVLLNYADRFYHRQFLTRKISNHKILEKFEWLLEEWFAVKEFKEGLPTVSFLAGKLHVSPDYLSSMLKILTGLNTQQHIHEKLIAVAKQYLSTTNLTVAEIAHQLGFEHSQSFSKLFKSKTLQSPKQFRANFN